MLLLLPFPPSVSAATTMKIDDGRSTFRLISHIREWKIVDNVGNLIFCSEVK